MVTSCYEATYIALPIPCKPRGPTLSLKDALRKRKSDAPYKTGLNIEPKSMP